MGKIVGTVICTALALIAAAVSISSFKRKGFLFNNSYIWASEKERKNMSEDDKKPYFIQSGIVFAGITVIFISTAVELIWSLWWMFAVRTVLIIALIVYAIVSSVKAK